VMNVAPVYVLVFAKARTPAPALVSEPAPEMTEPVWTMFRMLEVVNERMPPPAARTMFVPVLEERARGAGVRRL